MSYVSCVVSIIGSKQDMQKELCYYIITNRNSKETWMKILFAQTVKNKGYTSVDTPGMIL